MEAVVISLSGWLGWRHELFIGTFHPAYRDLARFKWDPDKRNEITNRKITIHRDLAYRVIPVTGLGRFPYKQPLRRWAKINKKWQVNVREYAALNFINIVATGC